MTTRDQPTADPSPSRASPSTGIGRRTVLAAGATAAAGLAARPLIRRRLNDRAAVFIAQGQRYDGPLEQSIGDGLVACGVDPNQFAGLNVLLKPNLVEPCREIPHMTTHPAMIAAAAEVFRRWGAHVTVGEAPGHVRDTEMALVASGVAEALRDAKLQFADLNYEEVDWRPNRGRTSPLKGVYLPRSVLEADLVVTMPKLKTHHWVGMTGCMKNFYGVLPGIKYGWPKNVLHHNGIPQTVVDINATVPSKLAIVDAIDCMEGDGPILGSRKSMGLVVVGTNLPAVDATLSRIMGLDPGRVSYLQLAENRLGPLADNRIEQVGQQWQSVASPFKILDQPHLRHLRATPTGPLVT